MGEFANAVSLERRLNRPTAAVQLEMGYRLSTPPLKFVAGLCCGLMHSLQPYSPPRSLLLAGVVATLLSAIHAVACLRTGDTSWLGGVPHPLAFPFALPTLCAHAVTSFRGHLGLLGRRRSKGKGAGIEAYASWRRSLGPSGLLVRV